MGMTSSVVFSADGRVAASHQEDGFIRVFSFDGTAYRPLGEPVPVIPQGYSLPRYDFALSADGRSLAVVVPGMADDESD